ncbi:hypothetical protein GobsT_07370 [Gemmata obscuriglobus]|nr:hypothetical protein [Gemmata obscuriglobus]QEG26002.1 hypothetical protein GobsT_07370 [Gemmata obscuriglobus]VTS00287.1 Uncharacterized protein OS=Singulisphaera acidiphila (strain ATCC BAA-1392 / DSM 18658 / VKM B-2454 / MOB10) GN=Sinac_1547 PE=4 SV=1 [Gemmata obscuriglobus UQM 2246]
MLRKMLLTASAVLLVGAVGCRHRCCHLNDPDKRPRPYLPEPPRNSILLPPAGVPTTPAPSPPPTGSSNFPPPALDLPPGGSPAPKSGGPEVLYPESPPGSSSARPTQPPPQGILGAPVKPQTPEPPKSTTPSGVSGAIKVKDGLFAGRKPTLDGFDALKTAGFRAVVYLHPNGQDVSAIKDMAASRGLTFHAIETTPETLSAALTEFNRVTADRLNRPAYVFGEDDLRAGAVWYLHLRTVDSFGDDAARLRAKPLGLSDQGDEGRAFALAIQSVLESR